MSALIKLEDTFIVASNLVSNESLKKALVLLYQRQDGVVSGLVVNKPESRTVKDYLAHPKWMGDQTVWYGGPVSQDRLIAISHADGDLFITDRLVNLTEKHLEDCLVVAGHCVWREDLLQEQIEQGAWIVVANNGMIPRSIPARKRIDYVLGKAGWNLSRYVHPSEGFISS